MTKKKSRPKLERPKKQYALDQCGLYGIKGFGQLQEVLHWRGGLCELEALATHEGSYQVWRDGTRTIQAACHELRAVHTRIAVLLRRVLPPDYRHSGIRDRSFLTNAQQHLCPHPSLKLDIKSFYPSTRFNLVRIFFRDVMHCSGDVAFLLAKLCCYKLQHLPTGGVHSEVVAFYCHKDSFNRLLNRVHARGGRMTVYVDDIWITMPLASLSDLEWARRLFKKHAVDLHPGKSQVIPKHQPKKTTGVLIRNGRIEAPPEQHLKVKKRMEEVAVSDSLEAARSAALSLLGHLDHIAQIDPRFADRARGNRARLKQILST